ncbi:G8 domain-containing protein DDB_G0286311-like [Penaeus monodon]|uniref:G8 domain-containing protein DDB_G0286311-like n=1 Tax=Penaeus monodon TaxID=6687 RepID=UPI0018A70E2A|nr:G8 domain-containing protein DDB_G0286311-like [Penaeus monodon]
MPENNKPRGKCGVLGDPAWPRWRLVALVAAVLALLLAVALATSLGVLLAKTECGAPPLHGLASTTYRGTAPPGTEVTYVCPFSLVFPNNERNHTIICTDDLRWSVSDLPACVRSGERHCTLGDGLSLVTRDSGSALEVDLLLRAPVPSSILADVPSEDQQGLCSYANQTTAGEDPERSRLGVLARSSAPRFLMLKAEKHLRDEAVYTVTVTDANIDPGAPYEVRLRGIGDTVAVSLLQDTYISSTIRSLEIETITPTATTPAKTTPSASATSTPTATANETPTSTVPSFATTTTSKTTAATSPVTTITTTSTFPTSTPSESLPTTTILAFASSTPHTTIAKPSVTTVASTTS